MAHCSKVDPKAIFEDTAYVKAHKKLMQRFTLLSYTAVFAGTVASFMLLGMFLAKDGRATTMLLFGGIVAWGICLWYRRLSADVERHLRSLMFRAFCTAVYRLYEKSSKVVP